MIVKSVTEIAVTVEDEDQAQSACNVIENGLLTQMRGFPEGEPLDVTVYHYEILTDDQIREMGLEEV